jgi:hypothetical protein
MELAAQLESVAAECVLLRQQEQVHSTQTTATITELQQQFDEERCKWRQTEAELQLKVC